MKLEQIKQVLEISRVGSLNKAAKNLYISQPNLSTSLRNLEKELNVELFTRTQHGMTLTTKGQQFLFFTTSVLRQFNQVSDLVHTLAEEDRQLFRVSNVYIKCAENAFIDTMREFGLPNLISQYREVNLDKAVEDVSKQMSDIGVVRVDSTKRSHFNALCEFKNVEYVSLCEAPIGVLCREGHPLAKLHRRELSAEDLKPYCLVLYGTLSDSRLDVFRMLHLDYSKQAVLVNSRAALIDFLRCTDSISIAPHNADLYKKCPYYEGIVDIPMCRSSLTAEIGIIYHREFSPNPVVERYIQRLRDAVSGK